MKTTSEKCELDLLQFAPRGAILRNSQPVVAQVVYTGKDTKLAQNQGKYSMKLSKIQKQLNLIMICNIAVMFLFIILVSFWGNRSWMQENSGKHFYIYPESEQPIDLQYSSYRAVLKFYLLFNSLVPLDLMVVFILSKMMYTFRLEQDAEMVDEQKSIESGSIKGCSVKNLELLQDFALLTNIFCDKTGTLTKNELVLSKFCVGGRIFEYKLDSLNELRDELNEFNHQSLINFFRCVCICHDAI
jgi:phospholipid-transporting ATPase